MKADTALNAIPTPADRDTWLKLTTAYKAAGGSFEVWDIWSAKGEGYNQRANKSVWDSITPAGGITEATLYREARRLPANTTRRAKDTTVVRFSYAGNMIDARTIEVEYASGRIEKAYEILTPPIVYEYAEKVKQIQQVETKLLDLRKRANSGNDTDTIKIYLLEQINAMKRDKTTRANRILLDTLFADLRIDITSRQLKKNKVDIIKRILEHFKTTKQKNGKTLIAGYSEVIGYRRALIGYDIHITAEKED